MITLRVLCLCVAVGCAGCGNDPVTPTSATSTEPTIQTRLFSGVLAPKGTRFYSYTVISSGSVSAMLASLSPTGGLAPATNRLNLGFGIPAGTGCAVRDVVNVASALIPQLTQAASPGTYCVSIADVDGLPTPMNFAVRLIHP